MRECTQDPSEIPSFVVLKHKLISEFGDETYSRCKARIRSHMMSVSEETGNTDTFDDVSIGDSTTAPPQRKPPSHPTPTSPFPATGAVFFHVGCSL